MERLTRTTWLFLGGYALLLLALLAYTLWQRSRVGAGWLFALITLAPVIPFFLRRRQNSCRPKPPQS
ncbi:hypothetical protein [Desulfuromonas thiophila]|uniref:Uncharacterized protein n=1 Tax=Desulfuromonas thiophila TaxID=57664 RepID=A0A1G7B8F5_9BACT|nr:hypothetical protein [Desulfuromonas thiophila]SDE23120.1 hypothetical protein SAMN05661003_105105 [Desulfuromonas thiophila]